MNHSKRISDLGKEATALKKSKPLAAALKIKQAVMVAIETDTPPTLDLELRYASYLYEAGQHDQAFDEIARLSTYGPALEKATLGSSCWYSDQLKILKKRIVLLGKIKSKEAYTQLISDSLLALRYEAMMHVKLKENHLQKQDEYQQVIGNDHGSPNFHERMADDQNKRLKWLFDFDEDHNLNRVGWKAFKALKLEDYKQEYREQLSALKNAGEPYSITNINNWVQNLITAKGI